MKRKLKLVFFLVIVMSFNILPALAVNAKNMSDMIQDTRLERTEEKNTANLEVQLQEKNNKATVKKEGKCGENLKWTFYSDGTLLISGEGAMEDFSFNSSPFYSANFTGDEIKKIVMEDGITHIGTFAFDGCDDAIGELVIPTSITSIGKAAFRGCSGFTGNLVIPASVTSIEWSAFSGCSGFTGDLIIGDSVTSIGGSAFAGCSGFTGDLIIGDSVTSIGSNAFKDCNFIGDLIIGDSVTSIEKSTFNGCSGFTGDLIIGDSVTSIGEFAFYGFSGFTGDLIIGDSVTSIDYCAFNGCSGFTGNLVIPSSVTSIGESAFSGCSGFTGDLVIPTSVTSIGENAFNGCSGFRGELVIPNSVTSIEDYAFDDCSGLTGKLNIPESITSIGNGVFSGCSGFRGDLVIPDSVTSIGGSAFSGCSGFSGNLNIPDSVTSIGGSAFSGCSGFSGNLNIPDGVTNIGDGAFSGCSGFTGNLVIPDSVISIGSYAFGGCSGLSGELNIPDNVMSIGDSAFNGCSGFTGNLVIPDNVISIGDSAFRDCHFTGYLTIGDGVTNIGEGAFSGCSGFTGELIIPDSVISIGSSAFSGCSGFTGDLVIPDSVTSIGWLAFEDCSGFTGDLVIGDGVTSIGGNSSFSGCSGFTGNLIIGNSMTQIPYVPNMKGFTGDLIIGDSVTSIEWNAFKDCNFTGKLIIGDNVTSIGDSSFSGCSGFTGDLVIGDGVTNIGERAFSGCSGFTGDLIIGDSVTSIESYAFENCSGLAGSLIMKEPLGKTANGLTIGDHAFRNCTNLTGALNIREDTTSIEAGAFYGCEKISEVYIPPSVVSIGDWAFYLMGDTLYANAGAMSDYVQFYVEPDSYGEQYVKSNYYRYDLYYFSVLKDYESMQNGEYFHVFVVDAKTKQPIENCVVNGKIANNKEGYVMFLLSDTDKEGNITLHITADGYEERKEVKKVTKNTKLTLGLNTIKGDFEITSVEAIGNGNTTDLLTQQLYLMNTKDTGSLTDKLEIKVKTRGDAESYELRKNGEVLETSTNGIFEIPVKYQDGKPALTELGISNKYEVFAKSANGIVSKETLGIRVWFNGFYPDEEDISFELGSEQIQDIAKEVPFVGGSDLNFGFLEEFPIDVEIDEGKIRVAINKTFGDMDEYEEFFDELNEMARTELKNWVSLSGGCIGAFEVGVCGYGEAIYDADKSDYYVDVAVIITGSTKAGYTKYFNVYSVPVYISVEGNAEVQGGISWSFGKEQGSKYKPLNTKVAGGNELTLPIFEFMLGLTVEGGVGINDFLSVNAAGTGELHWDSTPPEGQETEWKDEVYLKGWVAIYVDILTFEKPLLESPKARYDLSPKTTKENEELSTASTEEQMYDTSSYKLMDRSYLQKAVEELQVAEVGNDFVQTYVYPGASPKLVSAGDKLYLFWLQDIETRSSEDRASLVYAVSQDGENWSVPQQLMKESENQTLDGSYDLYVFEDKIYVCWQEATESLSAGISLEETLHKLQVSYAVLNSVTGEVIEEKTITSEEGCYIQPKICANKDKVIITWVQIKEEEGKSVLEPGALNKLMIYDSSKESTTSLDLNNQRIMSLDIDFNESTCGILYVLDENGDLTNEEDRQIVYIADSELPENQVCLSEKGNFANAVISGGDCYWYGENNIYYVTAGTEECKTIYSEARGGISGDFEVVSKEDKTTILWSGINYDTEQVSLYGIRKDGNKWTEPYTIQNTDSDMTSMISGSYLGEDLFISYLHIQGVQEEKCYSVCVTKEEGYDDIVLGYVDYDTDTFIPGESSPMIMQMTNKGNRQVNNVNLLWDGNVIATLETNLAVGETKEIEFSYPVSEDLAGFEEHTVSVQVEGEENLTDNSYVLGIGYTDLNVSCQQRLDNERTNIDITVANNSYISTNFTLNLRANEKDGAILFTQEFEEIEGNSVIFASFDLRKYENDCCTYFVEVVPGKKDIIEGDNIELVFTGFGKDIPVGKLTAPYYNVSFQSDGEEYGTSQSIKEGDVVQKPEDPTKEFHYFKGWYLNGKLYNFDEPVTTDIVLSAKWKEYSKLGKPIANIPTGKEVESGTKVTLSCAISDVFIYYTLDGSEPTTSSQLYQEPIEIYGDITIKAIAIKEGYKNSDVAIWEYKLSEPSEEQQEWKVLFDSNGGNNIDSQTIKNGGKVVRPEDPSKEGYQFEGWYLNGVLYDFDTLVTSDITLKAGWRENGDESGKDEPGNEEPGDDTPEVEGVGDVIPEDIPKGGVEAIPEGLWIAGIEEDGYIYTGKPIKPEVRVYDHTTLLKEKKDYTISYTRNLNVSDFTKKNQTPTITINGKGNYSGKETAVFKILARSLEDENITANNIYQNYNNKQQKPIPVVLDQGKKLVHKKHFTVEYVGITESADRFKEPSEIPYKIVIHGEGNYTGTKEISFTITRNDLLTKAKISKIKNQNYTGNYLTPKVEVLYKGKTLIQDTDYKVEYKDNLEVGTAEVKITGIGLYAGEKSAFFKITGNNIKNAKITNLPAKVTYTGEDIVAGSTVWKEMPVLKCKINGVEQELKQGKDKDYIISYEKNRDCGTATIVFTGVNGITGTLKKTFKIESYDIEKDPRQCISVKLEDHTYYAKGGSKPKPIVMFGNTVLVEGKDYILSYKNHNYLNDGTNSKKIPTVTVKGKGNFKGSRSLNYEIEKQEISRLEVSVGDKVYRKKAGSYQSVPKVVDLDGKNLKVGKDYEKIVTYLYKNDTKGVLVGEETVTRKAGEIIGSKDIVPAGTLIKVVLTGKGNYKGEVIGEYRIVQQSISGAKVKIESQVYTGKEIRPNKMQIVITCGKQTLGESDYEIIGYQNNTNKGTAKVILKGTGNYGGTKTVNFKIKKKIFSWWM